MSEEWQLLRSGPGEAAWNMAVDEALLGESSVPVLRLYAWSSPAATFGYFQRYEEIAAATPLRPLIRRCTGGGLVPHDGDWTYSLIIPPGHDWYALKADESYRRVHDWVSRSMGNGAILAECCDVEGKGRCFVGYEKHDVLLEGKKIAGAAQRRNRSGLMIQGSIQPPVGSSRAQWEDRFLEEKPNAARWNETDLSASVHEAATSLVAKKYGLEKYNRRR